MTRLRHTMDRTDAFWDGVEFVRMLLDVDLPDPQALRRTLRGIALATPVGAWVDADSGAWVRVDERDVEQWLDRVLIESPLVVVEPRHAVHLLHEPLGDLPFRIMTGPRWLALRQNHALGDGWSSFHLLAHLLRSAVGEREPADVPWQHLSSVRRTASSAAVARRVDSVARAFARRSTLRGGPYELADLHTATREPTIVYRTSEPGFSADLRRVRDAAFPGASAAGVTIAGLRRSLEASLGPVRPGTEFVFNTRSGATANAFGNFSTGLFLRTDDDSSPEAVTAAMAEARRIGLPEVAVAASRLRRRRRTGGQRLVAAPLGSPRLTLSYTHGHGPLGLVPGIGPQSVVALATVPNGLETVTVSAFEVGGQLRLTLSFYADAWAPARVAEAVDAFLSDPAATLAVAEAPEVGA